MQSPLLKNISGSIKFEVKLKLNCFPFEYDTTQTQGSFLTPVVPQPE